MDLNRGSQGTAVVFSAYNVFVALVWVLREGTGTLTPLMVGLHLGLALILASRVPWGRPRGYPWVMWLLAWMEIGWLYRLTDPVIHDGAISQADLALFGCHLNEVLPGIMPWTWLQEAMGLAYLSYYLLILGPTITLAIQRRTWEFQVHTFGLMTTYLACFAVYLTLPVLGPRAAVAGVDGHLPEAAGVFARVMQAFFAAGDSLGTAFPSSHCAASVAAALLVRKHFGRRPGFLAGIWASLIVVSTVYTNNHYAIDAVAGVGLALGIGMAVRKWLAGWGAAQAADDMESGLLKHEEGWS